MSWTPGPQGKFESVSLSDRNTIWVTWIGDPRGETSYVGKSTNGGVTWDTLRQISFAGISEFHYNKVLARNSLRAWVIEAGSLLADYVDTWQTSNGGTSWSLGGPYHIHGAYIRQVICLVESI